MKQRITALCAAALLLSTAPQPPKRPVVSDGRSELMKLARRATAMYDQSRFPGAVELYSQGCVRAARDHNPVALTWFLERRAGACFSSGRYRQALDDYLEERDIALKAGLRLQAAVAFSNLSSLYAQVYDTGSALAMAEDAYRAMPENIDASRRSQILANLGRVLLMRHAGSRALPFLESAIETAFRVGDSRAESQAWQQVGSELLRSGDLLRSEAALSTALRLRLLGRDPSLYATEYRLAELRLKQGDIVSARHLIDAAFAERGGDRIHAPPHLMFATRARISQAEGDLEGSLADYLRAADAADEWRSRGLFADSFRIGTDVALGKEALGQDVGIYDGAVDTAAQLYRKSGEQRYAVLSWELDERIRAASLREILVRGRSWTSRVPSEYWNDLDQLRTIEADEFGATQPSALNRERAARLRLSLAEMEARAGNGDGDSLGVTAKAGAALGSSLHPSPTNSQENFLERISLTRVRSVLGNSRTLISFHSGDQVSYRWVITDSTFELKVLPGKRHLEAGIDGVRAAVDSGSAEAPLLAEKLFQELFGGIAPDPRRRHWLVAPDQELFNLPFAALVTSRREGRPVYLVEDRAVELVPGAWAIAAETGGPANGWFVGVGDGIYNTADPRYGTGSSRPWSWRNFIPAVGTAQPRVWQWPRLIASGREIAECARRAGTGVTVLTGAGLNRQAFAAALDRRPSVVHIAAHFLWRKGEKKTAIALGLAKTGDGSPRLELLTADDIANLRVPGALIIMSGCSSSKGEVVPAAGLLNLSRAWLVAGASAVVATLWPTPDDTGELLARFYDHLRDGASPGGIVPAEALRRAQVDMLHSNTWRAEPRYWAAYQVMGRSN